MRVFEMQHHGNVWRHEFADNNSRSHSFCISGPCAGKTGAIRDLVEVLRDAIGWREVTPPPCDITKLDTAGVFHESPPSEMTAGRVAYEAWAKSLAPLGNYEPWDSGKSVPTTVAGRRAWEAAAHAVIEFHDEELFASRMGEVSLLTDDIRERDATIAELREANAALEETLETRDDERTMCMRLINTHEATIAELRQKVAELEAPTFGQADRDEMILGTYERELRDQMTKAWMRNDLTTADRIADLIGDNRPSEHEAADAGEVRA